MGFGFYTEVDLKQMGIRRVGKNVVVNRTVDLAGIENMEFGDNIIIEGFCILAALGDKLLRIGSHVHINTHCLLSGSAGIIIENFVGISSGTKLFSASDNYDGSVLVGPMIDDEFKDMDEGTIRLCNHALVGAGCVIMPGVTIGKGAAVGAMSFVNRDCEPWGIYTGVPAKRIKERKQDLLKLETQFLKQYKHKNT